MTTVASTTLQTTATNELPKCRIVFGVAVGLALLFWFLSPNFAATGSFRATPLGSDFLQEYTGGHIWLSENRSELYSSERFQAVQHDPGIVGFAWPESQYYPMVYPPFYYMLVSPLSQLPYQIAVFTWLMILGLVIGATVWCWVRFFPSAQDQWAKCLVVTVAFYPMLISFNTAHKSVILLFILTATYLLLYHKRTMSAGAVFGVIAFKPHLAIVIGVAMLLKGQWRFVVGCVCSIAMLVGLSLVAGVDLCSDYFWQCLAMSDYTSTSGYQLPESHSLVGAIALSFGKTTMASIVWFVATALTLGLVAFCCQGKLKTDSAVFALQFSLLILATILLSPHFYVYDLTIILLPIGLVSMAFSNKMPNAWQWNRERVLIVDQVDRQAMLCLCVAIFVGAGMASRVAETMHFQPTILIMLGMMFGIARILQKTEHIADPKISQRMASQ